MVTSYYRTIVGQNYRLAYRYLAPDVTGPGGTMLTFQAFLQLARMMDNDEGPVTSFSVSVFPSVTVMTIYRKRLGPYHAHLRMAREGDSWKIVSIDGI